jgi:hypothetical protein
MYKSSARPMRENFSTHDGSALLPARSIWIAMMCAGALPR